MKKKPLVFLLLLMLFAHAGNTQKLHAILVIDTKNPNTEFAEVCQADYKNIKEEVQKMAKGGGYVPEFYEATGSNFTSNGIFAAINSVKAQSNDVILFYYSGVGLCDKEETITEKKDRNRILSVGKDGTDYLSTVPLFSAIQKLNVRLNIFLIDACSINRKINWDSGTKGVALNKVYTSLLTACGTVRMFSSSCGEYSYVDGNGSFFSNSFIEAIDHFINNGKQDLKWEELLNLAKTITQKKAHSIFRFQNPTFFFDEGFMDRCTP